MHLYRSTCSSLKEWDLRNFVIWIHRSLSTDSNTILMTWWGLDKRKQTWNSKKKITWVSHSVCKVLAAMMRDLINIIMSASFSSDVQGTLEKLQ